MQYRDSYAIREDQPQLPPKYYPGYETKQEAEGALGQMDRKPGAVYSVKKVREYLNRARDADGNYTLSTVAEID